MDSFRYMAKYNNMPNTFISIEGPDNTKISTVSIYDFAIFFNSVVCLFFL